MLKKCKECELELPVDNFYEHKGCHRRVCKSCLQQNRLSYRKSQTEKKKEYDKKRYQESRTEILEKVKSNYNPDKKRIYDKAYNKKNPGRNRHLSTLSKRKRKLRCPKWLTLEQKRKIKEIYENCPTGFQVDHIIPLLGKQVSGLHVPWNLQYLTIEQNIKKGNRF